ncbi:peptide chain release factor N(5)-glutamine methyltransferase [Aquimarina sp. ERC-38]|uniref:peptide chain release factor N(5)-glutamine methyltransferase n=1 Tax=Aquimarina sp. ERC-38 TaxID=2949996 RepID=UPI002246C371|nr:peptide chain release factor N(5)-glutamine methyltransferase [Aquimarina sp. ERC-38]UZO82674.1 peptide chain release factor N(5)-glutamine methyltransferase [Aquimarina sp. ERC-38]
MNVRELREAFIKQLIPIYGIDEAQSFFYLASEKWLKKSRVQIVIDSSEEIDLQEASLFKDALERLKKEEPIQYILGEAFFYDTYFKVNKNVLIPRPETEELVRWIIQDVKSIGNYKTNILDIGTGSGCIAVTLAKKLKQASVSAMDISKEALHIAVKNAEAQEQRMHWIQKNILTTDQLPDTYQVIVSNPPYVRCMEKEQMQANVLAYEPGLALFVEDHNPLLFYQKIAELGTKHLVKGGHLYFEINEYLGSETMRLLEKIGYQDIQLRKDMYGKHRFIRATNK